ncbi:hypothetical protein A2U01_0101405, partial [Trifolium medium]|nr:hypothetical protein [Trifolium medium]
FQPSEQQELLPISKNETQHQMILQVPLE